MAKKEHGPAGKRRRGRPPIREITEPQRRTLSAIRSLTMLKGYPPTMREVAEELGIVPGSVSARVRQLIRKGYLRRQARKARTLEVIAVPEDDLERLVPLKIVGDVAARHRLLAKENTIGELLVEKRLLRQSECFALRAKGDSMAGVGINDGGYCVVRRQPAAENGDIVVAVLGDEGTVKRLHISDSGVELRSENPKYAPIPVGPDDDFRIVGKVTAVQAPAASGECR